MWESMRLMRQKGKGDLLWGKHLMRQQPGGEGGWGLEEGGRGVVRKGWVHGEQGKIEGNKEQLAPLLGAWHLVKSLWVQL